MNITTTPFKDLLLIEPRIFHDERGYFYEMHQQDRYKHHGLPVFVQDNLSLSKKNVLRGLHYQHPHAQGKLVHVAQGEVWDVVVDLRKSSPTFKQWFGVTLSDRNHMQMYVPPGFAHGFCVLSETAHFVYKCTDYYDPANEHGIRWDDPQINIPWPVANPITTPKDQHFPTFAEIPHEHLFS